MANPARNLARHQPDRNINLPGRIVTPGEDKMELAGERTGDAHPASSYPSMAGSGLPDRDFRVLLASSGDSDKAMVSTPRPKFTSIFCGSASKGSLD